MNLDEAKAFIEAKALRVVDREYPEDPIISGQVLSQLAGLVEITVGIKDPSEELVRKMVKSMRAKGPLDRDKFITFITMLSVPGFQLLLQYWDEEN